MFEGIQLVDLLWNIGKFCGLAGFVCLSLLIFSGDTARYFDRFFGMDKIIKFQRKFSVVTIVFVIFHPVFFIASSKSVKDYLIPDFTIPSFALGIVSFYLLLVVGVSSAIYKKVSYKKWQYIHIIIYILFAFGIYHAYNWGGDSYKSYIRAIYLVCLVAVVVGAIYRTYYKLNKFRRPKFFVKNIKQETKDTFTLTLKSDQKLKFKAGQFCFLRLNKNKLHARHPFTISSPPQNKDLQFTIKDTGRFTATASQLKKGEQVIVDGPFGIFCIPETDKELVFIAGGVGITPFMSILKDCVSDNKTNKIKLFYAAKTKKDIIFKEELDNLSQPWFSKLYIISNEDVSEPGYQSGRLNKEILEKHVKQFDNKLFYICGPKAMKDDIKKALLDLGVQKQDIIIEDFFW